VSARVVEARPLLVSSRTSMAVLGLPWPHALRHARELGIEPFRVGRKLVLDAERLLEALRSAQSETEDPAERVRRLIGIDGGKR
jgi:hypothetical protein